MSDFLTRRGSTWHFVRRVPAPFVALDPRGIVRQSTRIRIADDRTGRRAARIAQKLNEELEIFWHGLSQGQSAAQADAYEAARRRARALGFEYLESAQLLALPLERCLERLEALVSKGVADDPIARAAVLGTEKRPTFRLSKLFEEYEAATKDETRDLSTDQLRIWRNGRIRAVAQFVKLVGDKPVTEITESDGINYAEWWRGRILKDRMEPKTANKDIGQLSRMLKEMSIRRRLNLPDIFKGLRLRGEVDNSRAPFETDFIQNRLLAQGALDGLNEDARLIMYVLADTGLRPSEVCNLRALTIKLDAPVPHVCVRPDGRRLKTGDSEREIPLVGAALAALRQRPNGFIRYRDKASGLSATVNKYLQQNGLRPTKEHSGYSLRHSFKDRLIAAEAPDSLIDSLMGHKAYKPKYGRGPSLELKLKFLEQIAFRPPARL